MRKKIKDKDYQNKLLKEFRQEADFINEFYGLGDSDHLTAIELGHIYELMKEYKNSNCALESKVVIKEK